MFTAIGLDLDGTLLTSNKTISDASVRQLSRVIALGISIVIVSGRHYQEIKRLLDEYGIEDVSYIVSCDGQYIHDTHGNLVFSADLLGDSDVRKVFGIIDVNRLYCITSERNYCLTRSLRDLIHSRFFVRGQSDGLEYIRNWGERGSIIEKIVVEGHELMFNQEKRLKEVFTLHKLERGRRLELLPFGVDKYRALSYLFENGFLDKDCFLYFGDDFNDEECFLSLPHCVVMQNAPTELHHYSEFTIDTNDNDGIAVFLENWFVG